MTSPIGRRRVLRCLTDRGVSERAACRHLGFSRRVATYRLQQTVKDQPILEQLVATSQSYPRFGFRRAAAWLSLGPKRVRRLWRQLGLQLPRRRPRRRRCGSDIRLPGAPQPNSVWTYDLSSIRPPAAVRSSCCVSSTSILVSASRSRCIAGSDHRMSS